MVRKSLTRFLAKGKGKHLDTNLLGKKTLSYVPLVTSDRILDLMVTNSVTHLDMEELSSNHSENQVFEFLLLCLSYQKKMEKEKRKIKKGKRKRKKKTVKRSSYWITSCLLTSPLDYCSVICGIHNSRYWMLEKAIMLSLCK